MKRLTLTALSLITFAAVASPISALKANAQLFEDTPPEGADPAITEDETDEPTYDPEMGSGIDFDSDVEIDSDRASSVFEDEPAEGAVSDEYDGEYDGDGLSPEFEEENRETLNNR